MTTPTTVSIGVAGTVANIAPGVVSGGAPWVLSEVAGSTEMNPTVELSWECATPTEYEETNASVGFMFKPSDIGCGVQWLQRWTVRPHPTFAPTWLQLQLYGNSPLNRETPTHDLGNGTWQIRSKLNGLDIVGTIEDIDTNQGLVLNLEHLRFGGVALCQPGTYTLAAED